MKRYQLLPAQLRFMYVPNQDVQLDVCLYQGGYGSGKTFIGALLGHYLSYCFPNNRGLVVAQTYPLVRDTTLETYFEHLEYLDFKSGRDYTWKATEQKLSYRNGSEILFRHLDDPNKIKSLNLGWAHMEEMGDLEEACFLMLLSRLRLSQAKRYRLFGTSNPQAGKGWLKRYFSGDKITAIEGDAQGRLIQYRKIIAPSTENTHLNPSYLQNMRMQFSPEYYQMNVLGKDDLHGAKGLVCPGFSSANLDDGLQYQPHLTLYLSCDFNVDPMCWVVAHRVKNDLPAANPLNLLNTFITNTPVSRYEFFDELCIENTNIIQTAEEFARRYGSHQAGVVITGDATGKNRSDSSANPNESKYRILLNTLSNAGMNNIHLDIARGNPHQDIRIEGWNGLLCNQDGFSNIKIHPEKCRWLVWNLENMRYLPGTNIVAEPNLRQIEADPSHSIKFTKHPFDAASYLTYRYDPIRHDAPRHAKPIIQTHRFSPRGSFFT